MYITTNGHTAQLYKRLRGPVVIFLGMLTVYPEFDHNTVRIYAQASGWRLNIYVAT